MHPVLNPPGLLARLGTWPPARRYIVAYSGGLDSQVLLFMLAGVRDALPGPIRAVHVDHGVQPQSPDWAHRCREQCDALDVPFALLHAAAGDTRHRNPEARLRQLRYAAMSGCMENGERLLTAHHQDDQAETMLLQLLRGAGPAGLAAMPSLKRFAGGWHGRPFLQTRRAELARFADAAGLTWVEDPSNHDERYDRNFIRHAVLPAVSGRWPAAAVLMGRAADHQARTLSLLREFAAEDVRQCRGEPPGTMKLEALAALSRARQDNALRCWLQELGLPLPTAAGLARIHDEVIGARADARPCLKWPGVEVRRYRGQLHAFPPMPEPDPRGEISWQPLPDFRLQHGSLSASAMTGSGLCRAAVPAAGLTIRFRRGGERLRPTGARHERELKKVFQEAGIAPWLRPRIPLLFHGDVLAVVPGLWVKESLAVAGVEPGWRIEWRDDGG